MVQLSPQTCTLQWFEYVCVELLPTKPNEATNLLLEFRTSNFAFLARDFLLNTQLPIVKFQAALVLQYACILRWDTMSAEDQNEFRNLIWGLIVPSSAGPGGCALALPTYAVNKLTQVFALTWKRSWRSEAVESKQQFMFSLYNIVISASKPEGAATTVGALLASFFGHAPGSAPPALTQALSGGLATMCFVGRLLRVTVEEFSRQSSGGATTTSLAAHRQAHSSFEAGSQPINPSIGRVAALLHGLEAEAARFTPSNAICGLDDCFVIGISSITASMSHFGGCLGLAGCFLLHAHGAAALRAQCPPGSTDSLADPAAAPADVLLTPEFLRVCVNVKESFKLLIECLSWDFGAGSGSGTGGRVGSGNGGGEERRSYSIPTAWREHVFTAPLIAGIIRTYEGMRLLYLFCSLRGQDKGAGAAQSLLSELLCAMLEVRNLMLVYVSTAPPTGAGQGQRQQRLDEGSILLEQLVVPLFARLADPCLFFTSNPAGDGAASDPRAAAAAAVLTALIAGANATNSSAGPPDSSAVRSVQRPIYQQLRTDEYEYCCSAVARCLHNYRVGALAQMPVFTQQVLLLLGKNTFVLSEELAGMAARRLELQHREQGRGAQYSRELLAATLAPELCVASDQGDIFDGELLYTPTYVVDSWRGDVLTQLLDLWCAILENPLLLCYAQVLCPDEGAGAEAPASLKLQLKEMSGVVFRNLFRCMLLSSISQGCADGDNEEEEEEEEEGILEARLESTVSGICVIGKYQYAGSLALVLGQLSTGVGQLAPLAAAGGGPVAGAEGAALVDVAELVLGVAVRFATQLCTSPPQSSDSDWDATGGAASAAGGQYDALQAVVASRYSEQPDVSYLILDSFLLENDPAAPPRSPGSHSQPMLQLHLRLVNTAMPALLQCQCSLLQAQTPGQEPQGRLRFSALLMQHAFEFFDLYTTTFLLSDPSPNPSLRAVYEVHWGGAELGTALETLLQCVYTVTMSAYGEAPCLRAAYGALAAVAKVPRCREFLLQSPAYSMIVALVVQYKPAAVSRSHLSRLPMEALRLVVHSVGTSLQRTGHSGGFTDCCQMLYAVVEFCFEHCCGSGAARGAGGRPTVRPALLRDVQTSVVLALGLVRCHGGSGGGSGMSALHRALDFAVTRLQPVVSEFLAQQHAADDLVLFYALLLAEYADHQLGTLGATPAAALYCSAYRIFGTLDRRLRSSALFAATGAGSGNSAGAEALSTAEAIYEFELFRVLISLLNMLGTKDLGLDDDEAEGNNGTETLSITPQALEEVLVCTLFQGLHLAFTRTSPALLAHHPHLAERYFSFVQYLGNAYEKQFLAYLGLIPAVGTGGITLDGTSLVMPAPVDAARPLQHAERVAQQLLWCISSNATDVISTKLILSIINCIGTNYWNHLNAVIQRLVRQGQGQGVVPGAADEARLQYLAAHNDAITALLFGVLEHLFRVVSLPPAPVALFPDAGKDTGTIPVSTTAYPEQLDSYGAALFSLLVYVHTASTLPGYCPHLRQTHSVQTFIASASAALTGGVTAGSAASGTSTSDAELLEHFRALLTDRGMDYTNINNRAQRTAFCTNLKAYVARVKPLLLFR